jgi:hypothetical protein
MSFKKLREKLEIHDLIENDIPPFAFEIGGKYYTNASCSQEIDKAIVEDKDLVIIKFKK